MERFGDWFGDLHPVVVMLLAIAWLAVFTGAFVFVVTVIFGA
jgi:hypothetical protein